MVWRRSTEQSTCRGILLVRLWCVAPIAFAPMQWIAMKRAYSLIEGCADYFFLWHGCNQPFFHLALEIFGQNGWMHTRTLTCCLLLIGCACLYAFVARAYFHILPVDWMCVCLRAARDPKRTRSSQEPTPRALFVPLLLSRRFPFLARTHSLVLTHARHIHTSKCCYVLAC